MDSDIGGVNTTVAQIQAQLNDAKWQLEQTTIRAPANGAVTTMALAVGDRALQARAVMSFILDDDITIVGMFSANGFQTIKPGAPVKLVFDNDPGCIHCAQISEIPRGVGQGQIAVSGMLARVGAIGGARTYPGDHLPAGRHGSGAAAPRHARNRDGVRGQCGRHRAPDVDPGLGQFLYGVFVGLSEPDEWRRSNNSPETACAECNATSRRAA